MEVIFDNEKEFPEVLSQSNQRFSIDVLAYIPSLDEHTVAWFDFKEFKWLFLCNQNLEGRKFMWRYFNDEIDKTKYKK